jgi:cell division septum initiation protein DivIVA
MVDETDGQNKPISAGKAPGPQESLRTDTTQSTTSNQMASNKPFDTSAGSTGSTGLTGSAGSTTSRSGLNATSGSDSTLSNATSSVKEAASGVASTAKQYAGDMASKAKDKGRTLFEERKESALGQVGSVANAIRSTASNLQGEGQDQTARYVNMIADQLESLSGRFRNKDLDTLAQDFQGIARRNPGAFVVGSVVAGFLLARFLKSSQQNQSQYADYDTSIEDRMGTGLGQPQSFAGGSRAYTSGADKTTDSTIGADGTGTGTGTTTGTGIPGANGSTIGGDRL